MSQHANPTADIPDSLARADQLEREITDLCARINAASYRLLQLIAELDDEAPWGAWGLPSCAHWLNWRCGIGMGAAREKVRVAHALGDLPEISAAYAAGELSFSKVRALTRVADADNETDLLDLARHASAAQIEKLVRACRRVGRLEQAARAETQHAARELHYYTDDDGSLVIRARLPAEAGAVLVRALDAAMDAPTGDEDVDEVSAETSAGEDGIAQRRADALVRVAETSLNSAPDGPTSAERYRVVVHVSAETLAGDPDGRCELDDGEPIALDTVRRIACDSDRVTITEDMAGNPLDVGRKTRAISLAMRRALNARDGGCRFPGCVRRRFVDAHHIHHWSDGGDTALDNLVLLCRHHHRCVHEGGFGVERLTCGELRFTRPDGRVVDAHPGLAAVDDSGGNRDDALRGYQSIDAEDWIIAGDRLDLDLAIAGLLRHRETGEKFARPGD